MRVRHLQTYLAEQSLIHQSQLDKLKGTRIGVDVVFWLRSIQALKDPFAEALGGLPPGIFGFVDKELESFRRHDITPLFVFQGIAPGPQHSMFISRLDNQMDQAWSCLVKGQRAEAQRCFAISTSRINGDLVYFIYHHLRSRGYECLQAPYFAGAQLAHLMDQGHVATVLGPPSFLLYGISTVVMQLNFNNQRFDWVDIEGVLKKCNITHDQFVDICMMAGTEYCLTYPYLNLGNFGQQQPPRSFNFDAAIHIIKQAPLINWMGTFATEDMKNDHVDGYCICKVLIENSPVLNLSDHVIRPLRGSDKRIPFDYNTIMGEKLPSSIFYLMLTGVISQKLPQALAKGEWTDKSQPLVDTAEYHTTLEQIEEYRAKALGLIARHLHKGFQTKEIVQKAYWESHARTAWGDKTTNPQLRTLTPMITKTLRWNITRDALETEMKRQSATKVDFKFCLNWHAHDFARTGPLMRNLTSQGHATYSNDQRCLAALIHFTVLENLDFIGQEDGSATVLGDILKNMPTHMQDPCLVALELMKIGMLNGEPFEHSGRAFPEAVKYPSGEVDAAKRSRLLLSRVMSLVPMKLKTEMWSADVDFDLTAFHSIVRTLKRALRQLVEGSLASVLLTDLTRVKLLPPGFMCATPLADNHLESTAILPTFMLPRACMGIVFLFFLDYEGDPSKFAAFMKSRFPCCEQPIDDLKVAFAFWEELKKCVENIAETLGAEELRDAMNEATEVLSAKQQRLKVFAKA